MKLKKFLALGVTVVLTTGMLAGCNPNSGKGDKKGESSKKKDGIVNIAMVTDVGGVNDRSFNQSAWEGLKKLEKEFGKDKIKVEVMESKQDADYKSNLETLHDKEPDLIIGVGYKLEPAIKEASKNYPEQQYVLIDSPISGAQPKNVTSLLFEDNVSSYLTGLVAGRMSEAKKVGFIGGMEGEVISRFHYGFMAGAIDSEKITKENISAQYANSFTDQGKGKQIAQQMHSSGVDIIFSAAGDVGTGAIEAAKENKKRAIGVDRDQNDIAPDHVITSAMKNIDIAVFNIGKKIMDKSYKGGEILTNTLAMNGVGLAPTTSKNVPPDVLEFVKSMEEKIKKGEVKVPQNKEEFEAKYK